MSTFTLVGRLGQEPKEVPTQEGSKKLVTINLAVRNGNQEQPTWFNRLECWDKLADIVENYCYKGREVSVTGYLAPNEWTDKNTGETVKAISFKATSIQLLGSKKESAPVSQAKVAIPTAVSNTVNTIDADYDEIPF